MSKQYEKVGSVRREKGIYIITPEYAKTPGGNFGTFFKDAEAYEKDWDAPCYSEEACFDGADATESYFTHAMLLEECGYNERLCDAMFHEISWQCPDTWLNELESEDYAQFWSWLKVGCKAFWWLNEWWDADYYEVIRIEDAPEDYNPDTVVWLRRRDPEHLCEYEKIEARLWDLAETDISHQLQRKKERYYHSFIRTYAKVWWNDPENGRSGWYYVYDIDDGGFPWGDETVVLLKSTLDCCYEALMRELLPDKIEK